MIVDGAAAEGFLQNLLSQDLKGLAVGDARRALLLTAKARIIADPRVTRVEAERFLLDVDPVGVEPLVSALTRYRLGAKVAIEATDAWRLVSLIGPRATESPADGIVLDTALGDVPRRDLIVPAERAESIAATAEANGATRLDAAALEALRINAGEVRLGHDVDERWMPAEVGLVPIAVSFSKGCFIGQEPVTRLEHRGHANRGPRRLSLTAAAATGTPITHDGKEVGVLTSVAGPPQLEQVVGIGIVRVNVPADAQLDVAGSTATLTP